jgi:hypothetical protein
MDTPAPHSLARPPRSPWRLRALTAAVGLVAAFAPLALRPVPAAHAQAACTFQLGFATLRNMVGPATVGDCLENERHNPANGNAEQRTTRGLLVWRKADNFTAFTDGARTWINAGPRGLVSRMNYQRFPWESDAGAPGTTTFSQASPAPVPASPPATAPAPPPVRPVPAPAVPVAPQTVRSTIADEFTGWEGDTLFELDNGQFWLQVDGTYHYHYAYRPQVTIFRTNSGWRMAVDGVGETVMVEPLDSVIVSRIAGNFEGYKPSAVYVLANGQAWQQTSATNRSRSRSSPRAVIYRASGGWMLRVDGVDTAVKVQRLR